MTRDRMLVEVDEVVSFFERYGDCWKDGLPPLMKRIRERLSVSQAARDVLAERRRQVEHEGWTAEHDDTHTNGELADAASCYASPQWSRRLRDKAPTLHDAPDHWPWEPSSWKPGDRRQMLVKAAALLLAQIDSWDRAALSTQESSAALAGDGKEAGR